MGDDEAPRQGTLAPQSAIERALEAANATIAGLGVTGWVTLVLAGGLASLACFYMESTASGLVAAVAVVTPVGLWQFIHRRHGWAWKPEKAWWVLFLIVLANIVHGVFWDVDPGPGDAGLTWVDIFVLLPMVVLVDLPFILLALSLRARAGSEPRSVLCLIGLRAFLVISNLVLLVSLGRGLAYLTSSADAPFVVAFGVSFVTYVLGALFSTLLWTGFRPGRSQRDGPARSSADRSDARVEREQERAAAETSGTE